MGTGKLKWDLAMRSMTQRFGLFSYRERCHIRRVSMPLMRKGLITQIRAIHSYIDLGRSNLYVIEPIKPPLILAFWVST